VSDYFAAVVGQRQAIDQLQAAVTRPVHAYLFVGPGGSGKRQTARAFAAALLDDKRALHDGHPDVITVEREGASINVAQAREISRLAARSPIEGNRKVLILNDFHLVDEAAPALLKTIEEASESTIFVILADSLPREVVTVASRCVRIDFSSVPETLILEALVAEGASEDRARDAAAAAFGNMDRARLLAGDDEVVARRKLWVDVPTRLDGPGSAAAAIAEDVDVSIDHASAPLIARQEVELAQLETRIKESGQSSAPLKALETRQKREQRRLRTDELRAGFATLAQEYSRRLQLAPDRTVATEVQEGLAALNWANESLTFNPNETLLLQGLFVRLSQTSVSVGR